VKVFCGVRRSIAIVQKNVESHPDVARLQQGSPSIVKNPCPAIQVAVDRRAGHPDFADGVKPVAHKNVALHLDTVRAQGMDTFRWLGERSFYAIEIATNLRAGEPNLTVGDKAMAQKDFAFHVDSLQAERVVLGIVKRSPRAVEVAANRRAHQVHVTVASKPLAKNTSFATVML
jgi:hypothetical protein